MFQIQGFISVHPIKIDPAPVVQYSWGTWLHIHGLKHLTRRGSAVAQFAHEVFFLAAPGAYQASMSIIKPACQLFLKQFKAVHSANLEVPVPENSSVVWLEIGL